MVYLDYMDLTVVLAVKKGHKTLSLTKYCIFFNFFFVKCDIFTDLTSDEIIFFADIILEHFTIENFHKY